MKEPIHILLVDDREENLVSLGAILDSPEYRLVKVTSGSGALRALLDQDFALILMDVQMPVMDGFETAALIKKRPRCRHIPIIFITANSQDESFIYRGYDAGAVDYILKPISPDILRSKVAVFADLHQKTQQLLEQAELKRENERLERERHIARLELESALREQSANQRYRDLVAGLQHAIVWTADPESLAPTYVSETVQRVLGMSVNHALTDAVMLPATIPAAEREVVIERLKHATSTGEEVMIEHRMIGAGGEESWFQTLVKLSQDGSKSGGPELRGLSIDVTGLKRAEQTAVEAVRIRDEFLSVASHELKTPLTSLKLQVQGIRRLLGRDPDGAVPKMPSFAERCERQIDRLTRLVDDLLDVSRINNGKLLMTPETFDLGDVVRDVSSRFSVDLVQAGCTLELDLEPGVVGCWDRFRIEQVFTNLLTNAFKYGPSAPIQVRVWQDQAGAHFEVRDHGVGIQPADQRRIFSQFERAISPQGPSGLGLGLYIAHQIIEAHQGAIEVESTPGNGSRFVVALPLPLAEQAVVGLRKPKAKAASSARRQEYDLKAP
ncbi:MAG TPA: ATP-binding protein [Bdellovibrionota bacterium]|nr:ATP-binding protein [Bdellovibrionota bacterium]